MDTECKMNITCPYCGHEDLDSWDYHMEGDGETMDDCACDKCEKEFDVTFHLHVSYSTFKKEES